MGCGFSTSRENAKSSEDRERILARNNSSECLSSMGATQSKGKNNKSPPKKKSIQELTEKHNNKTNNGKNNNGSRKMTNGGSGLSSAPFNIQSTEISSSQVNFFKMLDEKIENGAELEEHDLEEERHHHLQRVAEEWDTLLGRSQDSNTDLPAKEATNENDHEDELRQRLDLNDVACSSVDSMRTMFSNSVTLPAGTLKELSESSGRGPTKATSHRYPPNHTRTNNA